MGMAKKNVIVSCPMRLAMAPLAKGFGVDMDTTCDHSCQWFRQGTRHYEATGQTELFESCAINVIADSSENQVQRAHALQQETGEMKNVMHYLTLMASGAMSKEKVADVVVKMMQVPDNTKQIGA